MNLSFVSGDPAEFDNIFTTYFTLKRDGRVEFPKKTFIRVLSLGRAIHEKSKSYLWHTQWKQNKLTKNAIRFCNHLLGALTHANFTPEEADKFRDIMCRSFKKPLFYD